jgi:TolB-like protein
MATAAEDAVYQFDGFVLDILRGTLLTAEGEAIQLRYKSFELLRLFVENAGRLLDRDTINRAVWPGAAVSDDNITQCVRDIRRTLGDDAQTIVKTVPRRGYVFAAKVSASRDEHAAPPISNAATLPGKPSIAVLAFTNMSGDPDQEYFVDGMVEEIITALSRIRWLFVMDRKSSFTYKGQAIEVRRIGRELGVRYVLEGSVRKAGRQVRITGQLIDAATGMHLWADRFDGSLEDIFELQDKVASSVAGVIEPALQAAETALSASRPTADLTAYDLYLRAYALFWSSARQLPEALRLVEQAIARDPQYGLAISWASYCSLGLVHHSLSEDPATDRQKAIGFARRALEVAGDDPGILVNAALPLAYFGEDIGAMVALVDRALVLNPNFARGWFSMGVLQLWAGHPEAAIKHTEVSLRLSPRANVGAALCVIGGAHFFARRFDSAVQTLLLAIQDDASYAQPYRYLAACYAHMDRPNDAREVITRLRATAPALIMDANYLRNAEVREMYLSGLRLAAGNPRLKTVA